MTRVIVGGPDRRVRAAAIVPASAPWSGTSAVSMDVRPGAPAGGQHKPGACRAPGRASNPVPARPAAGHQMTGITREACLHTSQGPDRPTCASTALTLIS